nr:MAG TPA: hypothetical protein [Bacteriophage sp.]
MRLIIHRCDKFTCVCSVVIVLLQPDRTNQPMNY